ncbi:hypothetical protein Cob_v006307 [Colletotrichum orbiculare MAFF 240422]|uniref:Uncharacterized protein n=1 Tax=Colletotrichum orbiculare (strain 104-T / ATCC 96160 / CBS 514.97 / LARS 414 / MAFF 240422) TaxID=1213857 RepID=A0A484FTP4_COLOR|nr:hypothetical protein Cob_v006307 [Colletotrichum orbiculare MAFF 240422]
MGMRPFGPEMVPEMRSINNNRPSGRRCSSYPKNMRSIAGGSSSELLQLYFGLSIVELTQQFIAYGMRQLGFFALD